MKVWRRWNGIGRLIVVLTFITVGLPLTALPAEGVAIEPDRQDAMSLFPREPGFTAWYSGNNGQKFRLTLDRIGYWSDRGEAIILLLKVNRDLEGGAHRETPVGNPGFAIDCGGMCLVLAECATGTFSDESG